MGERESKRRGEIGGVVDNPTALSSPSSSRFPSPSPPSFILSLSLSLSLSSSSSLHLFLIKSLSLSLSLSLSSSSSISSSQSEATKRPTPKSKGVSGSIGMSMDVIKSRDFNALKRKEERSAGRSRGRASRINASQLLLNNRSIIQAKKDQIFAKVTYPMSHFSV